MAHSPHAQPYFFWLDMEMTGLDETCDHVLEVAVRVTDSAFIPIEDYQQVVFQSDEVLKNMNDWCKEHHGKSGLTALVPTGKPILTVENDLLALCSRHFSTADRIVLCGNSIGNDRRFIERYLPRFAKRLHYRMIDVSSFKEVFKGLYSIKFEKKNAHRAIDDIAESVAELQHYLTFVKIPVAPKAGAV